MLEKGGALVKFMLIFAGILLLSLSFTMAQTQTACDQPITTPGHGAVELCSEIFVCGASDGICPEEFSDGTDETDENKTRVVLRVGQDRLASQGGPGSDDYPILYQDGNSGCAAITGTCTGLEFKDTWNGNWETTTSAYCDTDMSTRNEYVRAVCIAPKTAGCQNCPDPDCVTSVKGITYDVTTNQKISAHVNVVSTDNTYFRAEGTSSGTYNMQAPRGNIKVVCTAKDYDVVEMDVFLQKGENIVDCRLEESTCSSECTLPDIDGTPICASKCDLQNGCSYTSTQIKSICEGVPLGATLILNRTNETEVTGLTCCEGDFTQIYRPLAGGKNEHIPNLLTKDYRKELNGVPVNLRIITYNKE